MGIFIRSLVGLDRETPSQAFSQFVIGTTLTASKLEFIDLIAEELTENGVTDAGRLYEQRFIDINGKGAEAVWAAAGSVDTDLSFLSFLKVYRTDVAQR